MVIHPHTIYHGIPQNYFFFCLIPLKFDNSALVIPYVLNWGNISFTLGQLMIIHPHTIYHGFVPDCHGDDPDQTLCTQVYITKSTDYCIGSNFENSIYFEVVCTRSLIIKMSSLSNCYCNNFNLVLNISSKELIKKQASLKKISDKYEEVTS